MPRLPEGKLKAFVVGDPLTVDRKYRDPLGVKPTARLVFATNKIPKFVDESDGIWRRVIILPTRVVVPPEQQDKALTRKLIAELPGIFNWAVEGLVWLRKQDRFTEPKATIEATRAHRQACDPTGTFLREHYREDLRGELASDDLKQDYQRWCQDNELTPESDSVVGKAVKRVLPGPAP